jgi:cell division protein FtsZ
MSAVGQAINSPLVEVSIEGAKGILFGVAGGRDLKMAEISDIAKMISENVDPAAKIIFGAYHDKKLRTGQIKVTLIASGFNGQVIKNQEPPVSTLFNQLSTTEAVDDNKGKKEEGKKEKSQKKDSDIWDIPTFLRKGKK